MRNYLRYILIFSIFFSFSLSAQIDEYELKSIVIHKILTFVSWPNNSLGPQIILGVTGSTPIEKNMAALSAKMIVENRKISVIKINSLDEIAKCNIVFVAPGEISRINQIMEKISGKPILLISDSKGFAEKGMHINLFVDDNKVRFEINRKTVEKSQLKLSAKLYKLARVIE